MQSWLEEMPSFLIELYSHRDPPKRILIDDDLTEPTALENLLSQRAGYKVQITQPQRGELKSWLSMARQNAKAEVSCREATGHLEDETYLERIQDELQLPNKPMHAIALDCAIFSLEEPVGSIVVFSDGKIDKSKYRKFKVKGEYGEKGDVYAVEEVLERYLKRNLDNWPDVMLIDGGLQQLNAAANVILRLGYTPDRRLLSISKGEKRKRGEEQLHIYGEVHPRQFGSFPMSERFLTELRDEAHRTSNLFNGQRLIKERLKNPFLIIPGIGQQTAKKLRHAYGTMIEFEKSNPDKLKDIQGITSRQQKMLEVWIKTHRDEPK
jgi:excinuclease ABC subunit C